MPKQIRPHDKQPPLSREERIRRVVILCREFLRNLAYRRGAAETLKGWSKSGPTLPIPEASFWITASNNALDMCVLEFCKLFGERTGKHYWRKVVTDRDAFVAGLLRALDFDDAEYLAYLGEMKDYRDQFIAHLDDQRTMHPPVLKHAESAVLFLHGWIVDREAAVGLLDAQIDTAQKLLAGYEIERATAERIYRRTAVFNQTP
jgi:hypothetical protein